MERWYTSPLSITAWRSGKIVRSSLLICCELAHSGTGLQSLQSANVVAKPSLADPSHYARSAEFCQARHLENRSQVRALIN
jgi:hypothetical protein